MVQHLVQKHLAASLASVSEVARLYPQCTSDEHREAVATFLQYGGTTDLEIFDALLHHSFNSLSQAFRCGGDFGGVNNEMLVVAADIIVVLRFDIVGNWSPRSIMPNLSSSSQLIIVVVGPSC